MRKSHSQDFSASFGYLLGNSFQNAMGKDYFFRQYLQK